MTAHGSRTGRVLAVVAMTLALFASTQTAAFAAPLLGFGPLQTYDYAQSDSAHGSIVVDYFSFETTSHGSLPDVLVPNGQAGNSISVFTNRGDGTFENAREIVVTGLDFGPAGLPAAVSFYASMTAEYPSVLVCNQGNDSVSVLVNDGEGDFAASSTPTVPVGADPFSVAKGDFDNDDVADFVTANNLSDDLSIRMGDGDGTFSDPATASAEITLPAGAGPTAVVTGFFDEDIYQDIACTDQSLGGDSVRVYLGDGVGGFSEAPGSPFGVYPGASPYGLSTGDFDGNGYTDLITTNVGAVREDEELTVLLNNGLGSFEETIGAASGNVGGVPLGTATGALQSQPTTGGPYDDVVAPYSTISVLKNSQTGTDAAVFSNVSVGPELVAPPLLSVALGDANGDGFLDIFTTDFSSGTEGALGVVLTDNVAPVTTAEGTPTGWDTDWIDQDASVEMSATDVGLGVFRTYYGLNGAPRETYEAGHPVVISDEGTTTLYYYSVDDAGLQEETQTARIRIDKTAPRATIAGIPATTPPAPFGWTNATVSFVVSGTDSLSGIAERYYKLDAGPTVPFTAPVTVLSSDQGTHTVGYYCYDVAGNRSATETARFGIDSTVPSTTIIVDGIAPTGWANASSAPAHFTLSATDDGLAPMTTYYRIGTGTRTAYANVPVTVSAEGTNTVHYQTTDVAGNIEATDTALVKVDTLAPTTTSTVQPSYTGPATISVTGADPVSGIGHTFYKLDAGSVTTYTAPIVVDTPGAHSLRFYSTDVAGNTEATKTAPAFTVSAAQEEVAGGTRYDTAVAASRSSFATGSVTTVVIATGADYPDALSAAALAGAYEGPVLLTAKNALLAAVSAEIDRLGATRAVIVGGTGAVSGTVFEQLITKLGGGHVTRIAGGTRYVTAAMVADAIGAVHPVLDGTVFIATGQNYPDALAGGPDAWAKVRPILLVNGASVPASTTAAIASLNATRAVILGGTGAVPASAATTVQNALAGPKTLVRLAGGTRYGTAQEVARWSAAGEGLGWTTVGIATGTGFADALGGGPAMGAVGGPMMLTSPTAASPETLDELAANKATIMDVRFFGGTGAVPTSVRTALMNALE
jgi:putative cell wall-binding protein